ncbi:HpcH/HpaI aldolase/citrate lyase family protein [Candidatus Poriferisocius sp.]|uniref:HpcH/HpaI aldolase/citrate lyase family protein n=1 Tax=Candidatus Poriferisocius sp. TaxID=3101276 RepID=UPI003B01406F
MPAAESDPPPIRSLLFVPANRADRMQKALATQADGVVFDLESAITRATAAEARANVRHALEAHTPGQPAVFVRVSAVGTPDFAPDTDACRHPSLTALMLPQIAEPSEVAAASDALEGTAARIMPLVETASAVRLAYELATASDRVAYMGGATGRHGDLGRSVGFQWTPEGIETLYLRQKVLIDVRAAGVLNPLSGLWGHVDDLDGLTGFAQQTRQLGYEGMMIIHPSHIPIVNQTFSPTPEEVEGWRSLIAAIQEAQAQGIGAFRYQGRLIDHAHLLTAQQNLSRAERLGLG